MVSESVYVVSCVHECVHAGPAYRSLSTSVSNLKWYYHDWIYARADNTNDRCDLQGCTSRSSHRRWLLLQRLESLDSLPTSSLLFQLPATGVAIGTWSVTTRQGAVTVQKSATATATDDLQLDAYHRSYSTEGDSVFCWTNRCSISPYLSLKPWCCSQALLSCDKSLGRQPMQHIGDMAKLQCIFCHAGGL